MTPSEGGLKVPTFFRARGAGTEYVDLDRSTCEACGDCVDVCPSGVFKPGRRHVRLRDRDVCTGCLACVEACAFGALTPAHLRSA